MASVTQATEESIKLWLKVGNLKKLEQAVLDGYGNQLRGRNSRIPKINKFLKRVPHYQAKISAIHTAVAQGNIRDLENLLDRKGLAFGRDSSGATLLHVAVQQKQPAVVRYLLKEFPSLVHARDHHGRTALHYEAALNGGGDVYQTLVDAGADPQLKDMAGKSAADYLNNPEEFQLNPKLEINSAIASRRQSRDVSYLLRQPSPIAALTKTEVRSIIQKGDIAKLERAIQQGYGERLLGETATSTRVKDLLESIPQHLNKLSALQTAIENGSLREVRNQMNRKSLVTARDSHGLTIFHKAVLHGRKDIVEYLTGINPKGIFAKDHDKRTPVHYAAVIDDNGEIYQMLMDAGGNTSLPDCDGKTPEYYRQNPTALELKANFDRRSEGSGKLSNTNSNEYQSKAATKSGKREVSSPNQQANGNSSTVIKHWLRSGNIDKLEKAVIDGHGLRIIRETTADPRARAFLKTLPVYMGKIASIHEAVCSGDLRRLKMLLDRRKLALSRDKLGLGLLHKAVLFGQENVVTYLAKNYPETSNMKDKNERTPLHYAGALASKDNGTIYTILTDEGADPDLKDCKGNSAQYYRSNPDELDVADLLNKINRLRSRKSTASKNNNKAKPPETSFNITGGNIRKWIHAEDIQKLEQVVLEGQGYKLLLEMSNNPRVKQFLVSVPSMVKRIKEIHTAVVLGDLTGVESAIEKPALLLSKDELGMTPLHKAVLLEEKEIIRFIVTTMPTALQVSDEEGRTALHYAAGLKDEGSIFEMLTRSGADKDAIDNKGKSAEHYFKHPGELDMRQLQAHIQRNRANAQGKQDTRSKNNSSSNNTSNQQTNGIIKRPPAGANLRPVRKASSTINNETIARLIQQSDLEKLEQLVLDGHGKRLIGKSSWNEDVRVFLKKVPQLMDKIYAVHMAAATGDLLLLQQYLDTKKIVTSKDEYGLTALHKAVKYGQTSVVKYLLQTFPACHLAKDQDGRTPLHYAAMYKGREDIYDILVNKGADTKAQDQRGRSPASYLGSNNKLEAPVPPEPQGKNQEKNDLDEEADDQPSDNEAIEKEIEGWISRRELEPLEKLVIDGRGDRLLGKSSDDPKMREFLESVPAMMGKIRAIHNAAANGELKDVQTLIDKEILATSLDEHGASPLHKAVLYGHKEVMKFLANNYPACLNIQDKSGLTPLHYAALSGTEGLLYRQLSNCGADPNIKDKNQTTPGQMLRGKIHITLDELLKRYEEKKVPPRPLSVQMWERPPTEELLRDMTPSPTASTAKNTEASDEENKDWPEDPKQAEDEKSDKNEEQDETEDKDEANEIADSTESEHRNDKDSTSDVEDLDSNKDETEAKETHIEQQANADEEKSAADESKTDNAQLPADDGRHSNASLAENEEMDEKEPDMHDKVSVNLGVEADDTKENGEENCERNESQNTATADDNREDTEDEDGLEKVPEETEKEIEDYKQENASEERPESKTETTNDEPEDGTDNEKESSADDHVSVEQHKDDSSEQDNDDDPTELVVAPVTADKNTTNPVEESKEETLESKDEQAQEQGANDKDESTDGRESGVVVSDSGELSSQSPDDTQENRPTSPEMADDNGTPKKSTSENENIVDVTGENENIANAINESENAAEAINENENESIADAINPAMLTKEGEYLTAVLGDALINALAEVSRLKPEDPITFLSLLLYRYLQLNDLQNKKANSGTTKSNNQNGVTGVVAKCRLLFDEDGIVDLKGLCEMKNEDGATVMHYVARMAHRTDSFSELLKICSYNLAERNGSYQTIRDVANEKGLKDNTDAIDSYVFSLVCQGDNATLKTLMLDGYDHVLDILDDEGNDAIMVAELNHQLETIQLLNGFASFQEKAELLHESVRNDDNKEIIAILEENADFGKAKNTKAQTALHVAVLTENEDLVQSVADKCPSAINITDNMWRTPLHYAMGTSKPETLAKILVQKGGNQLLRDAAKHTPSFYFINNQDIQMLKNEMEEITV